MSKRILLAFVIVLTLAAFVACGGDEETVAEPEAVEVTEPAIEPAAADAMTTEPDMSDSTDAVMAGGMALADDCVAGGGLTDADSIIACNLEAMQRYTSYSFEGEFDLFAAFPIEGAPAMAPLMQLSGAVVQPDKTSFTLKLGPEGETVETRGILIGGDFYGQDPESQLWFKGTPPEGGQSLAPLQLAGMLYLPQDIPTSLEEVIDLDDGGKGYVLVSEQAGLGGEAAMLGLSDGGLTRVVGADDFLTREIRVAIEGPDGQSRDLFTIRYHGFGDELSIEAPESFVDLPPGAMSSGVQEPATVVGLTRNADGNVEVRFSKPVIAEGEIILYVLEPSTGGWELPLLSGSGTDTLVFDAAAEGNPTLVAGEHEIAFIGFGGNAQIVDADGARANDLFDTWKYE